MALFERGVYQSPLNWKTTSAAELPQVYLSDGYLCFLRLKEKGGKNKCKRKGLEKKIYLSLLYNCTGNLWGMAHFYPNQDAHFFHLKKDC